MKTIASTSLTASTGQARRANYRRLVRRILGLILALPFLACVAFISAVKWWPYPVGIDQPPHCSTLLEDRTGVSLAALTSVDGQWHMPLADDQINPHLLEAMVAVEDSRFYEHGGVDWRSAAMAAWQDFRGLHIRRGASTITMQVQRLRFPKPRSFFNKFEQSVRAAQIEKHQTKRQILVEYVNRAPFGGNLIGAGAASWRYFGRPCTQLSLAESALLAGLPQSPARLRPDRYPERATARRNHVLDRMLAAQYIDAEQHDEACGERLSVAWRPLPQDGNSGLPAAWGAMPLLACLSREHPATTLRTTLDATVQRQSAQAALEHLSHLQSSGVSAIAVIVLDNANAQCRASVSLSRSTQEIDLARRPRSTGSTLKPLIYAAAFEAGVCLPDTVLDDAPTSWAGYEPADYDRQFRGSLTAAEALAESRNIPAMTVLAKVGVEPALGIMEAAGLKSLARSPNRYGLSLAIGGAEASPVELAQAYSMLARGGEIRDVSFIQSMPHSESVSREGQTRQCLSSTACWQTLAAISGTDRTASLSLSASKQHVAWKTGTSSGHRDAWCAAVTRRLTVVVWMGNANGQASSALIGAEAAAPLALRLISSLDPGPPEPWPQVPKAAHGPTTMTIAAIPTKIDSGATSLTLVSPTPNQQFILDPGWSRDSQRILLKASRRPAFLQNNPQSRTLWWFVDGQPAGIANNAEPLWWPPNLGSHEIRVIDAQGHAAVAQVTVR